VPCPGVDILPGGVIDAADPGRGVSKGRPGGDKVRPPGLDIRNIWPQRAQELLLASFSLPQRGQIILYPSHQTRQSGIPCLDALGETITPLQGMCSMPEMSKPSPPVWICLLNNARIYYLAVKHLPL
jgi:hypothetical protein